MCFKETDILLPVQADNPDFMKKWGIIACDQYTSDSSYWDKIKEFTKNEMSALNLIFPEIYLEIESDDEIEKRIENIVGTMKQYEKDLVRHKNSMFYIERTLKNGTVRRGLAGAVDLEEYDYEKDSKAQIRSTEETVPERLPPRIKIRENALLELPHVMILYNDEQDIVMSELNKNLESFTKVYDFNLMFDAGKIKAYNLDKKNIDFLKETLGKLNNNGFTFAVGDGNHSLAAAKERWENIKKTISSDDYLTHPARYALAEIVNIYDKSLEFEPIYRVLFDVDPLDVIKKLRERFETSDSAQSHRFEMYHGGQSCVAVLKSEYNLPVKTLQIFLDDYIKIYGGRIDYIHGKSETIEFAKQNNAIGFIFDTMQKSDLFAAIEKDGVLPRKTFSMGEADDKRFYIECRRIK